DSFQNLFLNRLGIGLSILFEHEQEPAIAKFLALMAACFGHTIGKEHNAVAWHELNRADCEDLTGTNTEDNSAIAQAMVRSISMEYDRRVVAGIHVSQIPRGPVELSVEKCHKAVAGRVAIKEIIQACAEFVRRNHRRCQAPNGRLQIGHYQRGWHSLP